MKVILDVNVIVAAFAARGLCSEIFAVVISNHDLIISTQLLAEIKRTLEKKVGLKNPMLGDVLSYLSDVSHILTPQPLEAKACRDKSDLHVLGLALVAKANLIVAGDKDLLVLKKFKQTKILNPREFWTIAGR
ncbi:putative toxin-antitoxin system toxin component, PIN family [bacterium]|nr:putative toxin-antitoxin system toxin component, PIN family [bacterium]